ncbi:MAG: DUF1367 family protein [Gammaproteobacteria bacterium]|nr:DUF1367 family protein [Gammaproteobacteria bacterium]
MAAEALMVRTPAGLVPDGVESSEVISKVKIGSGVRVKIIRVRNRKFHRKFFALVNFAYDHWEPGEFQDPKWKGISPEKSKDRFRKDLTILAGFYEATFRLDGSTRVEAQSISFDRMDQESFDELYSAFINVVLKHVLTNYQREDLERVIEQLILGYG